jgi:hypothetical protein
MVVSLSQVSLAQGHPPGPHFRAARPTHGGHGQINAARARLYQLSPEERQAFQRNAERWLKMSPEQQKVLREREQIRRQQLRTEAESAMRQLGLRLDPNARDQFEARYLQERRRIERELREEVEAKRQQELPQLNERLKNEFQSHQGTGASTASPAASGKPHD